MSGLQQDFDWRKSPAHLDLLSKFISPRDLSQVLNWQYLKQLLNEDTSVAIDRFVAGGALIPCALEEIVERSFNLAQLKDIAIAAGLKGTGTKGQLTERILNYSRPKLEAATRGKQFYKCSQIAKDLLDEYAHAQANAVRMAMQKTYELLIKKDVRAAYKVYAEVQRAYTNPNFQPNTYDIEKLDFILTSNPKVLSDLSSSDLVALRASASMRELWRSQSIRDWLPHDFPQGSRNPEVAARYLVCCAEIRRSISRLEKYTKMARLVFDPYDIESCEECRKLNGQSFPLEEIPELPLESCTSESGCKCRIEPVYDASDAPFGIRIRAAFLGEGEDAGVESASPFDRLSQLKRMLEGGLITPQEYEDKKSQILRDL